MIAARTASTGWRRFLALLALFGFITPGVATAQSAGQLEFVGWGSNDHGQLSVPPDAREGIVAIAAGYLHTVALKNDGTVVAWGNNSGGQATVPAGLTGVTAIAAGGTHTVALKNDGTVVAWGNNSGGQATVPAGLTGVTAIVAGGTHTVALKNDGTVVA